MYSSTSRSFVRPDVPDGEYTVEITQIDAGYCKSDGRPRVRFQLRYLDGPCKGKLDWKINMLSSPDSKAMFTEELRRLAFVCDSPQAFREIEPELYRLTILASVSTTGEMRRIEFLAVVLRRPDNDGADGKSQNVWKW